MYNPQNGKVSHDTVCQWYRYIWCNVMSTESTIELYDNYKKEFALSLDHDWYDSCQFSKKPLQPIEHDVILS